MYIIMNVMSINLQLVEAFYAEEIGVGHALLLAKRNPAPGTGTRQLIQRGVERSRSQGLAPRSRFGLPGDVACVIVAR